MIYRTICTMCKHFDPGSGDPSEQATCLAFPQGIPLDILQFGYDHREPFEGDGGVMFTPDGPVDVDRIERIVASKPAPRDAPLGGVVDGSDDTDI